MTDSKRVFDLAKELNISHTDILDFLKKEKNIGCYQYLLP